MTMLRLLILTSRLGKTMAIRKEVKLINHVKKSTSQGRGGRGRRVKISTKHMNKNKRKSYKASRGQGR